MHHADIKAAIEKAGSSQSEIARSIKSGEAGEHISPGAVYLVIRGISKSARIAQAISAVTGHPVATLWPGKYPEVEFLQRMAAQASKPSASHTSAQTKRAPAKRRAA